VESWCSKRTIQRRHYYGGASCEQPGWQEHGCESYAGPLSGLGATPRDSARFFSTVVAENLPTCNNSLVEAWLYGRRLWHG
jgi:hypothetical protein